MKKMIKITINAYFLGNSYEHTFPQVINKLSTCNQLRPEKLFPLLHIFFQFSSYFLLIFFLILFFWSCHCFSGPASSYLFSICRNSSALFIATIELTQFTRVHIVIPNEYPAILRAALNFSGKARAVGGKFALQVSG